MTPKHIAIDRVVNASKDAISLFGHAIQTIEWFPCTNDLDSHWIDFENAGYAEGQTAHRQLADRVSCTATELGLLTANNGALRKHIRFSLATKLPEAMLGGLVAGESAIEAASGLCSRLTHASSVTREFEDWRKCQRALDIAVSGLLCMGWEYTDLDRIQPELDALLRRLNEEWRLAIETESPFLPDQGGQTCGTAKGEVPVAALGGQWAKVYEILDAAGTAPDSGKPRKEFIEKYNQTWANKRTDGNKEPWPRLEAADLRSCISYWKKKARGK